MYTYYLKIKMADEQAISDALMDRIQEIITQSNSNASSQRINKKITFEGRQSEYAFRVKLEAKRELVPSRAVSSISRSLLKSEEPLLSEVKGHIARHCVLLAVPDEEQQLRLNDRQVMAELLEIYFGRAEMSTTNKALALETADEVRRAVEVYVSRKDT